MTTAEIKAILVEIDPDIQRYESTKRNSAAYTVWREYNALAIFADGRHQGGIRFQVDRFTKTEDDAIANALFEALDARDDITLDYLVDYESDTGYIHHIYDCEGC